MDKCVPGISICWKFLSRILTKLRTLSIRSLGLMGVSWIAAVKELWQFLISVFRHAWGYVAVIQHWIIAPVVIVLWHLFQSHENIDAHEGFYFISICRSPEFVQCCIFIVGICYDWRLFADSIYVGIVFQDVKQIATNKVEQKFWGYCVWMNGGSRQNIGPSSWRGCATISVSGASLTLASSITPSTSGTTTSSSTTSATTLTWTRGILVTIIIIINVTVNAVFITTWTNLEK